MCPNNVICGCIVFIPPSQLGILGHIIRVGLEVVAPREEHGLVGVQVGQEILQILHNCLNKKSVSQVKILLNYTYINKNTIN